MNRNELPVDVHLDRFGELMPLLPMVFYRLDENGIFLLSEGKGLEKLGLQPGQVVGLSVWDVYRGFPDIIASLTAAYAGQVVKADHKVGEMHLEHHVIPVLAPDGRMEGVVGAAIDITDRIHAEEAMQEANRLLEVRVRDRTMELQTANAELTALNKELSAMNEELSAMNDQLAALNHELTESNEQVHRMQRHLVETEKMSALGGLVAGVAHEINTPLGVGLTAVTHLRGLTEELAASLFLPGGNKEIQERLMSDMTTAAELVLNNLNRAGRLDRSFKRVAADQAAEPKSRFSVNDCVDDTLVSLSPSLRKSGVRIAIDMDEPVAMTGYPGAFSQILTNLVLNAERHAFRIKPPGQVRIGILSSGDWIELHVGDDGDGMSEDTRAHLFEPFHTTDRANGGTGLGLFIVHSLATGRCGGSVSCETHPGMGTHFVVRLPKEVQT